MGTPFLNFSGVAAPLVVENVNTDAIIPASYLRSTSADLAEGLFARWRYDEAGAENPDFVLNRPPFRTSALIFAGPNFGCGSSREAAVWALVRFGIRCVAAPSFADIFYENAFRNGLLPAIVSQDDLAVALELACVPDGASFAVDLPAATISGPAGHVMDFCIPPFRREALLRGDDEIETTLRLDGDIARFTAADRIARPWIHSIGARS
ncbi:3-isopropylmalate dehydratase small subunit [Bosea beijingensis]|uniref:3-isopropylmalate dehydratase small subunit n=1 Tax=Bosea beijingensis TaxID=3068632 RepID=UPI00274149C2|nr:3-isopropylmalate dehydratase small subunit [Bosea sp. REN20]